MTNLAIRGHKERGKEVIEILKMLGGREVGYSGIGSRYYYYIDEYGNIAGTTELPESKTSVTYTLEEFLEKFPYKVGDKVKYINNIFCIKSSQWDSDKKTVIYYIDTDWSAGYVVKTDELQPYKEETMDMEERIKINIPKGYKFVCIDDGNQQVVLERIKYPKTYEECCKVLGCKANDFFTDFSYDGCDVEISDYEDKIDDLLQNFRKLRYYRDAYWKIAGEQMGLGKPWEPDWNNLSTNHEFIEINKGCFTYSSRVLVFPTTEMRDAFYENFNDLIEQSKELL